MQTIEKGWRNFSEPMFRGLDIPSKEMKSMERAFFAGTFVVILNCLEIGDSPELMDYLRARFHESRTRLEEIRDSNEV